MPQKRSILNLKTRIGKIKTPIKKQEKNIEKKV